MKCSYCGCVTEVTNTYQETMIVEGHTKPVPVTVRRRHCKNRACGLGLAGRVVQTLEIPGRTLSGLVKREKKNASK